MADTHKTINEEVEVTLRLKVKLIMASFYGERTQEQLQHEINAAKKNVGKSLIHHIENDYFGEIGESRWGYVNFSYTVEENK